MEAGVEAEVEVLEAAAAAASTFTSLMTEWKYVVASLL